MPAGGTLSAPTFSVGTATYANDQSVTITPPGGATGCYTTNGTDPAATTPGTCSTGTTYSTPVAITATATVLKALATQGGQVNSAIASATYTLQGATPTASPAAGTVTAGTVVTWSSTTTGTVTFHYRIDGVDPTCSTGTTGSSVTVSSTTTYSVVACKASYVDSAVLTAAYTVVAGISVISRSSAQDDATTGIITAAAVNSTGSNTIVVFVGWGGNNTITTTPSDDHGSTFTLYPGSESCNSGCMRAYYAKNITAASSHTVAVDFGGSVPFKRIMVWFLAGANTTDPTDGTAAIGTGSASPGTTTSITPSASTGMIISAVSNNDGATCVFTPNNSFSTSFGSGLGGTATFDTQGIEKIGSSGAQTPSIGMTATGGAWRMAAVGLKQ